VAVPISKLPDIIEETQAALQKTGLPGAIVGHIGDGNFHTVLFFGEDDRLVAETFVHNMVNRAIELEGTVTGEHGVGMIKRDYLPHEVGQSTVDLMRKVCPMLRFYAEVSADFDSVEIGV
jgi:D-lactate dehydrogenase (cytochrome)